MNTTQANRKWNQGYVLPTEPKELHASPGYQTTLTASVATSARRCPR